MILLPQNYTNDIFAQFQKSKGVFISTKNEQGDLFKSESFIPVLNELNISIENLNDHEEAEAEEAAKAAQEAEEAEEAAKAAEAEEAAKAAEEEEAAKAAEEEEEEE
jgi:peptidoglycan hydrolase CwlO-like protein